MVTVGESWGDCVNRDGKISGCRGWQALEMPVCGTLLSEMRVSRPGGRRPDPSRSDVGVSLSEAVMPLT